MVRYNQLDIYPTIGVDPGAVHVGLCARIGTQAIDATSLKRAKTDTDQTFVDRVIATIDAMADRHGQAALDAAATFAVAHHDSPWRIAVEEANKPKPYMRSKKTGKEQATHFGQKFTWSTAQTVGMWYAIMAVYQGAIVVKPAKFDALHLPEHGGSGNPGDYWPAELIGTAPRRFTKSEGDRNHQRSAYNVAGASFLLRPIPRRMAA